MCAVRMQYRTSYFPGLGWMMRRELWLEIGPHFPFQAWDHWMRLDTTSKGGAHCSVRITIGLAKIGAHFGYLAFIISLR